MGPGTTPDIGGRDPVAVVEERFRERLEEGVRRPLEEALRRYGEALGVIVADMAELADETMAGETGPHARYRYADRFTEICGRDPLGPADREREAFFRLLDAIPGLETGVPEAVITGPADPDAARPDRRVRPRPIQRLTMALRRPTEREVPTGPLARLYLAELSARLESVAGRAASLDSVALAAIRRQLHAHMAAEPSGGAPPAPRADESAAGPEPAARPTAAPDPWEPGGVDAHPESGPADGIGLEPVLATARQELDIAIGDTEEAFSRAVRAPAVHVDTEAAKGVAAQSARRRERVLQDWQSFETALQATAQAEAVLARALAELDAAAGAASRELEEVLDARAHRPLDRLAAGLEELAGRAPSRLDDAGADAVERLRSDAAALFDRHLPALAEGLPADLREAVDRYTRVLERIPESIPEDLRISDEPIAWVPDRSVKLGLRDAPLDELLTAVCRGTLPRWIERTMNATGEELEALRSELVRVRNAVDFHIRAPLTGDFEEREAIELIVGSMERAASQLEDLRDSGLDSVERLIAELERRSAEEADAVGSAVADREFLRMRSEIAEEQAVRRLSRGLAWGRRLADTGLRLGRRIWGTGRRTLHRTQDWAERQLGVAAVEREDMLETLEASLLGEEQRRLQLPGLYRQLFDVEEEVPWEELLVPRDEELATLGRALERWRRGQAASIAVVGEKGSGKTTLLRLAAPLFAETPVRRVDPGGTLPDPDALAKRMAEGLEVDATDWEALAAGIRSLGPTVVVVEDAHHLFIRALGGFRAMEAFLELVGATRDTVLWVITIDEYAWRYLDRVLGVAPHFTHTINTTNLSPERLERAIMARHEVSGFALRFELDADGDGASRWWQRFRKKEAQGELTRREVDRKAFFRELNQNAEGNVFLALFYWLRSVQRVEDHVLTLHAPEAIDLEFMERLPLPHLHTIAAIILHGGLSEEEHRLVFQLSPAENRLQLAALADASLIFRSADGEYKVNKVLYRPLIRLFRSKNIF